MQYSYNGIQVESNCLLTNKEISKIISHLHSNYGDVENVRVNVNNGKLRVKFDVPAKPVEHIRRITGYLVGTLDRFNDGKKAEERDRVKHI